MSKELQVFEYEGASVRMVMIDGEPWLVAKDVCDVLGLTNPTVAIQELDDDERSKYYLGRSPIHGGGGEVNVINEAGLYKLTFKSRKPAAKEFTRKVTHEILPQIRKTGFYIAPEVMKVEQEQEPLNIRVRIAGVLQRLALQVSSKADRDHINREAYKYATGEDLPTLKPKSASSSHSRRYWTAQQLGATLKWPTDAVMHRAEKLGITKKTTNGYWDGDTWYFSKEGRQKFLELVRAGIVKIEDGYEYYENGYKRIHWSFDPDAARL